MKLRDKITILNTGITLAILLISCLIILKAVDNFNLYTVYQSLLAQSDFSRQYLSEYFKLKEDPARVLKDEREILEDKLGKQAGCTVEITGSGETGGIGGRVSIGSPGTSVSKDNIDSIADTVSSDVKVPDSPGAPDGPDANDSVELKHLISLHEGALKGSRTYLVKKEGPDRQFYLAAPVYYGNRVIGSIIYKYSLYQVDSMRRSMQLMLLVLFLFAAVASLVMNFLSSFKVINPLEKLTCATKEYSRGNFREIAGIHTGDEIERLTLSFNEMGQNIMEMIDELKGEQIKQKKFLDSVTHEIRTPLTNILGYADLTRRVAGEDERIKYLSHITGEGNRLLAMVNDLLELSRLKRYEHSVEKENTDLKVLVEQAAVLMADRAKKFGFSILNNLQQVSASVDREKIKQVIINLVDNSIKYSEGKKIELKLWKDKMIYIQVSDNGIGIPKEDINNITEPFYRVDKSRSRKSGGNGLGLSICEDIIKAHNGSMTIESEESYGTTVTISLQP